jgi:hypothetical protein
MTARAPLVIGSDGLPQALQAGDTLAAAAPAAPYVVGRYYPTVNTASAGSPIAIATAALLYMHPFDVRGTFTINALAAIVNFPVASGNFQLALYADNNGSPTGTPVAVTGNISTAGAGGVSGSITPLTYQLKPGRYWAALMVDSTAQAGSVSFKSINATGLFIVSLLGADSIANAAPSATIILGLSIAAAAFGTWPDLTSKVVFTDYTKLTTAIVPILVLSPSSVP